MKTIFAITVGLMAISVAQAKNKVISIDDVRVTKKEIRSLKLGEMITPPISLWTQEGYPPQAVVSCVTERVPYSSKKEKTYSVDIQRHKDGSRTAQIQLLSGESVDLEYGFFYCE